MIDRSIKTLTLLILEVNLDPIYNRFVVYQLAWNFSNVPLNCYCPTENTNKLILIFKDLEVTYSFALHPIRNLITNIK